MGIMLSVGNYIRFRDLFTVMQTCKYALNNNIVKKYIISEAVALRKRYYCYDYYGYDIRPTDDTISMANNTILQYNTINRFPKRNIMMEILLSAQGSLNKPIKWYKRKLLIELEKRIHGRESFEKKYSKFKTCRRKECYGNYYCGGVHWDIPRHCRFHIVRRWHEDIVPIKYSI